LIHFEREDSLSVNSFHTSGSSPTVPCRVGLLGCGTVGSAVVRRLAGDQAPRSLALTHVFDRRATTKRASFTPATPRHPPILWTSRIDDLLTSDADVIVEAIGGADEAVRWMEAALLAGKSVVTCNKQAIARHGAALQRLAARQGRQIRYEGAVGGAMPIVRTVGEGLAGDRVTRIVAILNGTTNAVLSRMEALRCPLESALADARSRGYAEADPAADLDGLDAGAKLSILCALAFGLRVDAHEVDARSAAAITVADFERVRRAGGTIRQLACAEYDAARAALTAWVAPSVVARGSFFARTTGPQNAAVISGAFAGDIRLSGIGAGGDATAVAVLGDLLAIARDKAAIVPAPDLRRPDRIFGRAASGGAAAEHVEADCLSELNELGGCRRDRAEAM
jgi:homoserine dehydrogenase